MKTDTLEPDFREQIEKLLLAVKGVTDREWVVTSARRTIKEQNSIYAQGRSKPGQVVTNAKGGQSPHNFGLAADLAPLKPGTKQIDWNAPREMWQLMADCAVEMGLTAGFYFHSIMDMPHVEHPRWKEQQALWKSNKIQVA